MSEDPFKAIEEALEEMRKIVKGQSRVLKTLLEIAFDIEDVFVRYVDDLIGRLREWSEKLKEMKAASK